ncbi:MAG: hypothetical protein KKH29_05865 [Candidatus Omnitrophica bacterium]|nr:hypothetical protein [Candidatus Omnitrophota bacterium]MBU4346827.1 hypothetical protein [Candidatus Omnitrophota bacterium]MBU4472663.1 hypothetical protein [Candidatus Omnitrophota bacterium]MCG2706702.1 hypothetical protein [Candidatus Omnitrophota bacterium]
MNALLLSISILIAIVSIIIGLLLLLNPALAIKIQKKFYERINWRIEPISMPKEIRNTRIMGLLLTLTSLFTIAYIIIKAI